MPVSRGCELLDKNKFNNGCNLQKSGQIYTNHGVYMLI